MSVQNYIPDCEHPVLLVNEQAINAVYHGATIYWCDKPTNLFTPYTCNDFSRLNLILEFRRLTPQEQQCCYVKYADQEIPLFVYVPCGHCDMCHHKRQVSMINRARMESQLYDCPPYFFTLTYDDDHLPYHGELHYKDVQDFFKRLRIRWTRKGLAHHIRYLVAGEYGTKEDHTHRPHYHVILWNNPYKADEFHPAEHLALYQDIFQSWGKCQPQAFNFGQCGDGAAGYVAKYVSKESKMYGHWTKPFLRMSTRHGGIGAPFIDSFRTYFRSNPMLRQLSYVDRWTGKLCEVNFSSYIVSRLWPSPLRCVPAKMKALYSQLVDNLEHQCAFGIMSIHEARDLARRLRPCPGIVRNRLSFRRCRSALVDYYCEETSARRSEGAHGEYSVVSFSRDFFSTICHSLVEVMNSLIQDLAEVTSVPPDYLYSYSLYKAMDIQAPPVSLAPRLARVRMQSAVDMQKRKL